MYSPPTARQSAACGRPARHGPEFRLDGKRPWPAPAVTAVTETARYGTATASGLGPDAPAAGPPAAVEGPPRRAARHRGHRDPAPGRPPARRPRPGAAVAVDHRPASPGAARWTAPGRRSCAASTSSTPSGSSSSSSAGPARSSATRPPPTAGPGSSSPATPSSASPAPSPKTCACPGSGPARPAASPPPASAGVSVTSTARCPSWPARRNPASPAPGARRAQRTAGPQPATTSAKPPNQTILRRRSRSQTG